MPVGLANTRTKSRPASIWATTSKFLKTTFGVAICVFSFDSVHANEDDASSTPAISFQVPGTLESVNQETISADTEQFKLLTIEEILPHGSEVKLGESVVKFESESYEEQLGESERDLRLAEIVFEEDVFADSQARAQQTLDRQAAQRAWEAAKVTFDNYMKVDLERSIASANFSLKQSLSSLRNAQEELKQLQQMYEEDDLTEESEEIVLKRAKQAVESAEFRYQSAMITCERAIEQEIPRRTESQKETLARAEMTFQKAIRTIESEAAKREIELNKKEIKLKKQQADHEKLEKDRPRLNLTAQLTGIAVYGKLQRGKLSDKPPMHEIGTSVNADQVLITIMDPSSLQVRLVIPEANLKQVQVGDPCQIKLTSNPEQTFKAQVQSMSKTPFASTQYDCVVGLDKDSLPEGLLPLMTCEVLFLEKSEDVVDLPSGAVQ